MVRKILRDEPNTGEYELGVSYEEFYRKQLTKFQRSLRNLRPKYAAAQKEFSERDPVFLKQIEKMEADLKITQATYDSLNALHTQEVGKLAKFTGE